MNTQDQEFKDYESFSKRMEEKFPKMFANKYGGFACGKGWWPLLEQLCGTIQHHIDWREKQGNPIPQVVIEQIKEKFGTLRFYYQGGDDYISGAVSFAENVTDQLCEECGDAGTRRSGGWIRTLCDKHEAERQEKLRTIEMKSSGFEE
jgi:hypothetical protein